MEPNKKTLWKQLCSTKQIQATAQKVCQVLQLTSTHHVLSMIVAPLDENTGDQQECHQKVELEKACLAEARCCFTQASNTPLLTPPLVALFGESGQTKAFTQQVQNGTFHPPPACNPYMAKFLAQVCHPTSITEVMLHFDKDYCHGWQMHERLLAHWHPEYTLAITWPAHSIQRY